jgi:hypothetical protein
MPRALHPRLAKGQRADRIWHRMQDLFLLTSLCYFKILKSRDSSVGIALGYGLDDRVSRVRFPAGAGNFSHHHRCVQNGSRAHPASYPMGTRGSFPGGKVAGGVKLTALLHLVPR